MKILKNQKEKNQVTLEIEIEADSFQKSIEKGIEQVSKEIRVPGFRPGKAPRKMVEQHINMEAVSQDSAYNLISDEYPNILKESSLSPVDKPNLEITQCQEGKPLQFTITVDVYPEVKIGKYIGLKADKKPTDVTEEEIQNVINNFANRLATLKEVSEQPIKKGHVIELDMRAISGSRDYAPLTRSGLKLAVGDGGISPEFDEQIIGLKVGDKKEFEVSFNSDYPIDEIAGKEIKFNVSISKIFEKEMPEINDEFAKKIGGQSTIEELKKAITSNIEFEKMRDSEADLRNKLLEQISVSTEVDIPEGMIAREVDLMLDELEKNLAMRRLTLESYLKSMRKEKDSLREELKPGATSRVKAQVILKEISDNEKIEPSDVDVEVELNKLAKENKLELDEFKKHIRPETIGYIKDYLKRMKALDFVVEKAKINEK